MRLLAPCKILDVVSFLHCVLIIFSLSHPAPPLKSYGSRQLTDLWITSLLFDLHYKRINWSYAFSPG